VSTAAAAERGRPRLSARLSTAIYVLLAVLLVHVLVEEWLQQLLGAHEVAGSRTADGAAALPKAFKSAVYIALAAVTVTKVVIERRLSDFRTPADLALVALAVAIAIAGAVNDSSPTLIGQSLFVYLRGVIVFYAWRALAPDLERVRRVLVLVGAVIAAGAAVAVLQMIVGHDAYRAVGWDYLRWADDHRAQGLLRHPNDLGHAAGLALLGLAALFAVRSEVDRRLWAPAALFALAIGAAQSRESILGSIAGLLVIAALRRARLGRLLAVAGLVVLGAAIPLAIDPDSRHELERRITGVGKAIERPSNEKEGPGTREGDREVRVLYAQQSWRLFKKRPVLGYGAGQFGGIVAVEHDPNWFRDRRFGPEGFDRHGFRSTSVDSFWLHLVVEVGAIGTAAYLAWLALLGAPLLAPARRRGPPGIATAAACWALAAMAFALVVAFVAPSLEDPLFPPLLFTALGVAWVARGYDDRE
jgi:hypothetical protein